MAEPAWKRGKVTAYYPELAEYTDDEVAYFRKELDAHFDVHSDCKLFECTDADRLVSILIFEGLRRDGK